jgi:hypothetical protein
MITNVLRDEFDNYTFIAGIYDNWSFGPILHYHNISRPMPDSSTLTTHFRSLQHPICEDSRSTSNHGRILRNYISSSAIVPFPLPHSLMFIQTVKH